MPERARTVVIVDDDAQLRRAVARFLKASGFQTRSFSSGESFFASAFTPADWNIFDIHMPGMSGFDLAERLHSLGIRTPIIFITARDDTASRERACSLGAVGFLVKPFDSDALLGLLQG